MDQKTAKWVFAGAVLLGILLAVFLMGRGVDSGGTIEDASVVAELPPITPATRAEMVAATKAKRAPPDEYEFPADLPPPTKSCRWIVTSLHRRVPMWSVMDQIRDSSMKFTEEDMACMEGNNVNHGIKQYAKSHRDYRAEAAKR